MVHSKGWDWENAEQSVWLKPAEDSYYLANKWKEAGRTSVLDLGTGLGRHAIYFAKCGFQVSALDISEYGIRHLKSWAENEMLSIPAEVGDMLSLPYPDRSFDCVFAYHVISHCDTVGIKRIIAEIQRVLKPNGEVFLTFSSKEAADFKEASDKFDENTVICQKEGPEKGVPHFYANLQDVLEMLSGFNIEKIRHIEYCSVDIVNFRNRRYYYVNANLKDA